VVARASRQARRGFTLVEVLVASAVGLIILTGMMGYLVQRSRRDQQEAQLARLKQDATLVLGQLGRELRQAGLGRPTRARGEGEGEIFPGPLIAADQTSLAFVADLPRPDASLNGLSSFAANQAVPPMPDRAVALLNELNGGCDVDGSSPSPCRTDVASLLLAPSGVDCSSSPGSAPTCPWGLKKYRPGEWLVLVDGMGRWVERRVSSNLYASAASRIGLQLSERLPRNFFDIPNRGWVASVDQVFYRLQDGAVERKQCWSEAGYSVTARTLSRPCSSPADGTQWEPLVRTAGAEGFTFRYFDVQGFEFTRLPLSDSELRRIRRVEVRLSLSAPAPGEPVTYDTSSSFALRH
jgi:prepilin-type N-terminal cleavage/methylation domain-containing protein